MCESDISEKKKKNRQCHVSESSVNQEEIVTHLMSFLDT